MTWTGWTMEDLVARGLTPEQIERVMWDGTAYPGGGLTFNDYGYNTPSTAAPPPPPGTGNPLDRPTTGGPTTPVGTNPLDRPQGRPPGGPVIGAPGNPATRPTAPGAPAAPAVPEDEGSLAAGNWISRSPLVNVRDRTLAYARGGRFPPPDLYGEPPMEEMMQMPQVQAQLLPWLMQGLMEMRTAQNRPSAAMPMPKPFQGGAPMAKPAAATPMPKPFQGGQTKPMQLSAPSASGAAPGPVRERPQAPLTLADNGDVGPAIYMRPRQPVRGRGILPQHKSLTDRSEGHTFGEGGGYFNAGGRAKKARGSARKGAGAPMKGYADGGRMSSHHGSVQPFASGGRAYTGEIDYGQAGGLIYTGQPSGGVSFPPGSGILTDDPRFFERYLEAGSEGGGGESRYRLRPDVHAELEGRGYAQVGPRGAKDPSKVEYSDKFGWVTPVDNLVIREPDFLDRVMEISPYLLTAFVAGQVALPELFASMGSGAGAGTPGMLAPGMEGAAMLESQLLNAGILPGSAEWTAALTEAGLTGTGAIDPSGVDLFNAAEGTIDNPLALEQAAANPAIQSAFEGAVASGEVTAGTGILDWLRANPGLVRLGASLVGAGLSNAGSRDRNNNSGPGSGDPLSGPNAPTTAVQTGQQNALDLSSQIANELFSHWRDNYKPLELSYLEEAKNRGGAGDVAKARERAIGDVAGAFSSARGQITRNLGRYGMGSKAADAMSDAALKEGAARAGASNMAADRAEKEGRDMRGNLVAMAQGIPGRAVSANSSAAGIAAQMDQGQRGWAALDIDRERTRRGLDLNEDMFDYNRGRQDRRDIGNFVNEALGWFGIGRAEGGRIIEGDSERVADATEGGQIEGPGTETSDDVPAMLSDGEMVINAQAVKMIDAVAPGLLDRVNDLGLKKRVMEGGLFE